jgi:hypothetical protein
MGWGRTLLLGDIGTQLNLDDVERDLENVKDFLRQQQETSNSDKNLFVAIQRENHDLKMYLATLIRLLVSKNVLTQDELNRFVDLLDPAAPQA